jgi:hypothetical protein
MPVLKRRIHSEPAYEELACFEEILSFEQFGYRFDRLSGRRTCRVFG